MKNKIKILILLAFFAFANLSAVTFAETLNDVCPNIPGVQVSVPAKFFKQTETGNCYVTIMPGKLNKLVNDYCLNIQGIQFDLPEGTNFLNDRGNCVKLPDLCPNILGDQLGIPKNMAIVDGDCVSTLKFKSKANTTPSVNDMCANIPGLQIDAPQKYEQRGDDCFIAYVAGQPNTTNPDYCLNIPYIQTKLPEGFKFRNDRGNCI